MDQTERVVGVAMGAECGLSDPSALDFDRAGEAADGALEDSLGHLRDQRRRPNHHASYGDQLVNVCREGKMEKG